MTKLRRFTDFILQGRLSAMSVAFLLSCLPIIGSLSVLVAGLVTLRKGALEGFLVLVAATLPYVLSYYASSRYGHEEGMLLLAMTTILASNFFVWFFAILLRHFNNWSPLLEYGLLIALSVVALIHIIFPDVRNWWQGVLTDYFKQSAAVIKDLPAGKNNQEAFQYLTQVLAPYATGICIAGIIFNSLLQLTLARWWQAIVFNPGGLRQELHTIRLSYVMGGIFLLCFIIAAFKSAIALDMLPIFFTIFTLAALSLVHYTFNVLKTGWVWLMLFYIIFILLFRFVVVFLSILALLDVGLDFRKRLVRS